MTDGVVEVRVYKLKPGMRTAFQAAADEVMEMLARHRISVVGHGPSAHDADSYYLIRAYPSLEEREQAPSGTSKASISSRWWSTTARRPTARTTTP